VTDDSWSRDGAIAAYLDALSGVLLVARGLRDEEWPLPTDLPAWNVFDIVAHVYAIEDELAGRPVPSSIHDWSQFPHVTTPFQQYTEVGVEALRGLTPEELVGDLTELLDERTRQLASTPDGPDAEMRGPAGMVGPVHRVLGTRTLDMWAHEQDVRRATGRPTRMSGPAAEASLRRMVDALPIVVARQAEAPAGSLVRFVVTGSPGATATVGVDEEGHGTAAPDAGDADATLTLNLEELQLLFCGRRSSPSVAVEVRGDTALAERVILALAVTP
jgi:uncharacterized protein (TIGR03083 family)